MVGEQYALRGSWVIPVRGDLDLDSLPPVRAALEASTRLHPVTILDASAVTFADSSALNLLLECSRGATVRIASVCEPLSRLLRITGADQVLAVRSTPEEAADG